MHFSSTAAQGLADALLAVSGKYGNGEVYASLHTANPGSDGTSELSGGGYERQPATFVDTSGQPGTVQNSGGIVFADLPNTLVSWMGFWTDPVSVSSADFLIAAPMVGDPIACICLSGSNYVRAPGHGLTAPTPVRLYELPGNLSPGDPSVAGFPIDQLSPLLIATPLAGSTADSLQISAGGTGSPIAASSSCAFVIAKDLSLTPAAGGSIVFPNATGLSFTS